MNMDEKFQQHLDSVLSSNAYQRTCSQEAAFCPNPILEILNRKSNFRLICQNFATQNSNALGGPRPYFTKIINYTQGHNIEVYIVQIRYFGHTGIQIRQGTCWCTSAQYRDIHIPNQGPRRNFEIGRGLFWGGGNL